MKKPTVEDYCREIREKQKRWKLMNRSGCNDPYWTDGQNMNLLRNHIIYAKKQLEILCEGSLPEEYFLPLPPVVPNTYMANLKQKERVERLQAFGNSLTCKKVKYNEDQLSF